MTDLETRLRGVDAVPVPDLRKTIHDRASYQGRAAPPTMRPARVLAAAMALVLAGLAVAALVWAFRGTHHVTPLVPRPNGAVATVERGPDELPGVDNTDIVAIDPSTGSTVHLTSGPEADTEPVWSPDGTRVAFFRTTASPVGADLEEGVLVMNSDGTGLRQIWRCGPPPCLIGELAWSPDDVHLAWVIETHSSNAASIVQVIDTQSGSVTDICDISRCDQALGFLAWSPDGTELAFAKNEFGFIGLLGGPLPGAVWVARADGSDLIRLTEGRRCIASHDPCFYDWRPAWAPDGRTLAFLRDPSTVDGFDQPSLILANPDGTGFREYRLCSGQKYCQPSTPHWSPDGSSIVLGTDVNEVLRFDVAAGDVRTVPIDDTPECEGPTDPFWSPDGKLIAFEGGQRRTDNLCAVPKEGGTPEVVVRDTGQLGLAGYTWLPAGVVSFASASPTAEEAPQAVPLEPLPEGKLVFVTTNGSNNEDEALDVWVLPAGAETRQLTFDDIPDSSPALSPDGGRIAVAHDGAHPNTEIWVMNTDGTDPVRLTDYRTGAVQPAWSPDGSRIAFVTSGGYGEDGGIYVMNADGTDQHVVAEGNAFDPAWTHDGSGITFALNTPEGHEHLRTVDLATGHVTPVLDLPGSQQHPRWSPDGSTLAFTWWTPSGSGIYLADADGTHVRRLAVANYVGGYTGDAISWSPDGTWIAFGGIEPQVGPQVYVVRADGTGLRRVTDFPGFLPGTAIYASTGDPSWGP